MTTAVPLRFSHVRRPSRAVTAFVVLAALTGLGLVALWGLRDGGAVAPPMESPPLPSAPAASDSVPADSTPAPATRNPAPVEPRPQPAESTPPVESNPPVLSGPRFQGTGPGPNEPAGFTEVTERGFNELAENGWQAGPPRNFSIVDDPSAPVSPPHIGRATFPAGFGGGTGPIRTGKKLEQYEFTSIYISFWVRFSDNWFGHPSGVNKILHIWVGGVNHVYLSAQGTRRGRLSPQINLQGIHERPVSRNLRPNQDGRALDRGVWHHWEVVLRSGTPGMPDASVEWWVDGRKAGAYFNINMLKPQDTNFWEKVDWNPTWGGRGGQLREPQYMDMDDFYISGTK